MVEHLVLVVVTLVRIFLGAFQAPSGCVQAIESELKLEGDIVQLHELDGKAMDVLKDRNGEARILL